MHTDSVVGRLLRSAAVTAIIVLGSAGTIAAQSPTLAGVWALTITPSDCTTNAPLGLPSFRTLLTFHRDGTVTESVAHPAFAVGQRSAGHGTWKRTGGRTYEERTVGLIVFTAGVFQQGWHFITRTITMVDPNHYVGSGASQFVDMNGEAYLEPCATVSAERVR